MSIVQKLIDAQDNQDLKAYNEVLSEDYYWLRHSTGEKVPRDELMKKFKEFFDNMKGTDGLISMKLIQTGPNNMCTIGEWKDEQSIAKARDKMIAGLDTVRPLLEEISPELGVTDPVSGPVIMEDKQYA